MRWSERQIALLREIGVRMWLPAVADAPAATVVDAPSAASVADDDGVGRTDEAASVAVATAVAPAGALAVASVRADAVPGLATPPATALDWPELREAVAACRACRLCEGRRQTVFGVGNPRAHWMIVGEAPGEQEDRQGEPFVGKSGQLLDNMLRAIGLTREDASEAQQVYIANTIKCRPPGNRNPEPDELAKCEPFLIRQLQLVQPKLIVAMGRFAVQSLLRSSDPIGRLRGRVHRYQGIPLIVTYHPAYLLRNPEDKAKAWDDLCLALDTAEPG